MLIGLQNINDHTLDQRQDHLRSQELGRTESQPPFNNRAEPQNGVVGDRDEDRHQRGRCGLGLRRHRAGATGRGDEGRARSAEVQYDNENSVV